MMRAKWLITIGAFLAISFSANTSPLANAYGEVSLDVSASPSLDNTSLTAYNGWYYSDWREKNMATTAAITLSPGSTERDLHFSWYAITNGNPAVMIGKQKDGSDGVIVRGEAHPIAQSNGFTLYNAYNQVSVTNFLNENTTYYYRYTNNIDTSSVTWSNTFCHRTSTSDSYTALLVGDPQIGASGSVAADTYSWNQTLKKATDIVAAPAFLMSVGDQINAKTDDNREGLREREYAGFLYPEKMRQLSVAAAIGNHETKGTDYKYHFNNPNRADNLGDTPSGCDYYFSYGDAVFIVLNSNSRALSEHRKCMKKALDANPDATWRIVMFHHDIYGSGESHSNRTSANMRILLAPLMDEFDVDLVISGHDHSYARSYPMLDGTAIKTSSANLTNPYGTVYLSLGSSTGSKMYNLIEDKQFYVAERSNVTKPTFSTLHVTKSKLILKTFDIDGNSYAKDFTIQKTKETESPLKTLRKYTKKTKKSYTISSWKKFAAARNKLMNLLKPTETDKGAAKIEKYYGKKKDPLSYYGYAAGTTVSLPGDFSTLLYKTREQCISTSQEKLALAQNNALKANNKLVTTSLSVYKKGKTKKLKNKTLLSLKKGNTLKLKVTASPSRYKVTYKSSAKKYVSISKEGIIRAKKVRKKPINVTIRFQNRTLHLRIKVKAS